VRLSYVIKGLTYCVHQYIYSGLTKNPAVNDLLLLAYQPCLLRADADARTVRDIYILVSFSINFQYIANLQRLHKIAINVSI